MGKKSGPKQDPALAQAAMMSAQTGKDYLEFMQGQAGITNGWATEDRNRYQTVFQPLQDQYIADAATYASPDRIASRVGAAEAGVQSQLAAATGNQQRQMEALGVNPNSGRFITTNQTMNMAGGLAAAGAGNMERRAVRGEGEAMKANAINMGSGLAVNPGTSMGIANAASNSGFSGAMAGYGQQASILNTDYQNRRAAWQDQQGMVGGLLGGIGQIAGMAAGGGLAFLSDKDAKEDVKAPAKSSLKAIESMPINEWKYKKGRGDGGRHIGPMAQDWKKATGRGTGRTIDVVDAVGHTMRAVQEVSGQVKALTKQMASLGPNGGRKFASDRMAA